MIHLSSTWGDTGNKPNSSLGIMAIILGLKQEVTFSTLQKVILSLTLRRELPVFCFFRVEITEQ